MEGQPPAEMPLSEARQLADCIGLTVPGVNAPPAGFDALLAAARAVLPERPEYDGPHEKALRAAVAACSRER